MSIKTFRRGIHPPGEKIFTAGKPIERLAAPERLFVPLTQHFGKTAKPVVKKGDVVLLGQKIGEADSAFSSAVHAPVSGKVFSVDFHPFPSGTPVLAVTIENDGRNERVPELERPASPFELSPEAIIQKIRDAGVVGLGGAAFPTAVKLTPPKGKSIDTIVLNGCECEPIQTGDYRLMLEFPAEIMKGAELLRRASGARRIVVGVEDNKADALEALRAAAGEFPASFEPVKTKYPQGAEKMLIFALLDRKVPRGGLPFDVGVNVQNVATAKAAWDAVSENKPLYERVLTCAGPGVIDPKNLLVRVGTPARSVIDFCGGLKDGTALLTYGGPMMGISQAVLDVPVIKSTTGILAFFQDPPGREYDCIRCARCVEHCPMGLLPTSLAKFTRFSRLQDAEKRGILDCIECGCCQYSCPARIPLVQWIRLGKSQITAARNKKSAA